MTFFLKILLLCIKILQIYKTDSNKYFFCKYYIAFIKDSFLIKICLVYMYMDTDLKLKFTISETFALIK